MRECGCGEFRPIVKMPAPDGAWYAIEVYPGCDNCGASWALTVARIAAADLHHDAETLAETPEASFDKVMGEWHQQILDADILRAEFAKSVEGDDTPEDTPPSEIATFSLGEFVSRGGLITVFRKTLRAHRGTPTGATE
jgi:hypothetical protein